MNEWASKFMNAFPGSKSSADFDRFIAEVRNQAMDHMSFQREFDEELETRPSFEQVSQDSIIDEANKNILVLKSLESIMQERMQAYSQFLTTLSKSKSSFEVFQYCNGSLRQSLDSFFVFIEQELQQARQQLNLNDIRKSLSEMKVDAQKKLGDYQKEIFNAEREVSHAEKKLAKTKEQLEKHLNWKEHMESESSNVSSNSRKSGMSETPTRTTHSRSIDRIKESEELLLRYERDIKDDTIGISRALAARDEVLVASRRAFQNLDMECKKVIGHSLKKLVAKERETNASRNAVLDKLEATIDRIDIEGDITEFILTSREPEGALVLQSQALNILGDLNPSVETPRSYNSQDLGRKNSFRDESNSDSSSDYSGSGGNSGKGSSGQVVSSHNSQAFSQLIFSVHNMFGSAGSMFAPSNSSSNLAALSPTRSKSFISPSQSGKRRGGSMPDMSSSVAGLTASTESRLQSSPSSNTSEGNTTPSSQTQSALESSMEAHLNVIFFAKKGLEISTASVVAAALSNKASNVNDVVLSASDALTHCQTITVNKSASKDNNPSKTADISNLSLEEAVTWLVKQTQGPQDRAAFITELNKFRSRKVDVGEGFLALGAVLWSVLQQCQATNDVHSAKVIMMLIQTFYRKRNNPIHSSGTSKEPDINTQDTKADDDGEDDENTRGIARREFLKEILTSHPIWQDANFWEQVLWRCAVEQLQTIPYPVPWHDMDKDKRTEMVIRIHNVIFSQVMAIAHSMMELGCGKPMIREFVYRMCTIHQLTEAQRQQMLVHLLTR